MQWPVKARGCQHLSFLNHDIGNQILAVYPERGAQRVAARVSQLTRWDILYRDGVCFVPEQAGKTERRDGGIV